MISGQVARVADERTRDALEGFLRTHYAVARAAVSTVSMDMHKPCIAAVMAQIPRAEEKICLDRFHIAQHLGAAFYEVRRAEHRTLGAGGDRRLARTRHL